MNTRTMRTVLAAGVALASSSALGQSPQRVSLSVTEVARPVQVAPGGEVVLRGMVHSSHDGSVIDALTTTTGEGERASTVPGGLYDYEAGGWRLVSRDLRAHAYRLAATGQPGTLCEEARVSSPCLPLRLLPLAQSRLQSVEEFSRSLSGALTLEVLNPDDTPPPEPAGPGFLERTAPPLAGAITLGFLAYAAVQHLRRRARSGEAQVRQAAAKVRARLRAGDPVHQRLIPALDALVAQAEELAVLRDRLNARVASSGRDQVEARRRELASRSESESADARTLVDEQLARIDRWDSEADRAAARIDRILEYLRVLDQRLADAQREGQEEADAKRLAELERDVQAALEGAREADQLVTSTTP